MTLFLGFLLSIAALAESPLRTQDETTLEAVDALIEAGEEEGILEESDRELVRSAVEFGDKVVREVMTPRPEMFAVAGDDDAGGVSPHAGEPALFACAGLCGHPRPHHRHRVCA